MWALQTVHEAGRFGPGDVSVPEEISEVLTEEQKAKLAELIGEPKKKRSPPSKKKKGGR